MKLRTLAFATILFASTLARAGTIYTCDVYQMKMKVAVDFGARELAIYNPTTKAVLASDKISDIKTNENLANGALVFAGKVPGKSGREGTVGIVVNANGTVTGVLKGKLTDGVAWPLFCQIYAY